MMFSMNKALYYMPLIISLASVTFVAIKGIILQEEILATLFFYCVVPYFTFIVIALVLVEKVTFIKTFMTYCLPENMK